MKINLLPPPPPKVRRYFLLYWISVGLVLLWLLASVTNYLFDQAIASSKQSAISAANLSIAQMQAEISKLQGKAGLINQSAQLQPLRSELPQPLEAFKNLSSLLPQDGSFSAVDYAAGTFSTAATLGSYNEAAAFITALQNDPLFTNVNVTSVSSATGSVPGGSVTVPFSVTLASAASGAVGG